ncbi:MAG: formate--tetrahydrofolate ligase [Prevotellaceae bacterium]|nr:formate--tetrahydrofolate ligase [Prevotellaceae bacterium]
MKSDIDLARECVLEPIETIAGKIGIPEDDLEKYGKYIAKVPNTLIDEKKVQQNHLVLVTAMSPTKAGIGKTTVSIGLSMALNRIGKKSILALREPSLGPCFGMKGGAAGGGYSQVLPMEKINLHFTGDFHAITTAHNMITALLDNYLYQHHDEGFMLKEVLWKRVLDINDRNLRSIVTGLGAKTNGLVGESGFDITPASEIMAIFCLAKDEADLRRRIENILLGITADDKPFTVKDLGVAGAIMALLQDAIHPNLVQTMEHTAAFIHGGPFANIAHGCNSILATKMAMTYSDYCVTEAGFGADLGAEKFLDIKCRIAGIHPAATVVVCTLRGLKLHGGVADDAIDQPDHEAVKRGLENLAKHIENMRLLGQTVVVTLNRFYSDTEDEIAIVSDYCKALHIPFAPNEAFMKGGEGCEDLAREVVAEVEKSPSSAVKFLYDLNDSVEEKVEKIAKKIYGAGEVVYKPQARKSLAKIKQWGYDKFPVCIAKTQYSFSDDAKKYGVPKDFTFTIRDFVVNAGAEMIVAIAGSILRMPGLPKHPQAEKIDVINGLIEVLS